MLQTRPVASAGPVRADLAGGRPRGGSAGLAVCPTAFLRSRASDRACPGPPLLGRRLPPPPPPLPTTTTDAPARDGDHARLSPALVHRACACSRGMHRACCTPDGVLRGPPRAGDVGSPGPGQRGRPAVAQRQVPDLHQRLLRRGDAPPVASGPFQRSRQLERLLLRPPGGAAFPGSRHAATHANRCIPHPSPSRTVNSSESG